jgi:hypothetical protein
MEALARARKDKAVLEQHRAVIDRRILHLKQTIATLLRLTLGEVPGELINKGLTDAIREIIEDAALQRVGFPAKHIKELLETIGYDFTNYRNPLASITGTLERLVASGEAKKTRMPRVDGKHPRDENPKVWVYYSAKMPINKPQKGVEAGKENVER